jgi:hypothetical protein
MVAKKKIAGFQAIYAEADAAGHAAAVAAKVVPMIVGSPVSFFGNEIDYSKPIYNVPDGPCGFAWISIKPGGSSFARWIKAAGHGRADSYAGGVSISVGAYRQSLARKEAYAMAFANVLRKHGIVAYSESRMD